MWIHPKGIFRFGHFAMALGLAFLISACEKAPADSSIFAKSHQAMDQSEAKHELMPAADNSAIENPKAAMSEDKGKNFEPFYVYIEKGSRLNHFVPSGFMPNGKCLSFEDTWSEDCHDGRTCIKINYDLQCSKADQKWAGIYWLNPANNWGQRKGGYNLTGASKLTFWAKGERGGEQIQEFTIGGITGTYPDSDMIVIGPIILTDQWRQYSMDLRGKDLSYISGGFAWSSSAEVNEETCTFYLDNIRFE